MITIEANHDAYIIFLLLLFSVVIDIDTSGIHAFEELHRSLQKREVQEYLEHYKLPKLAKLKKFVVNVDAWKNTSLSGCTHVIGAAPHLKEFELKAEILRGHQRLRQTGVR
ncbi:hypothetical protein RND71_039927 [Anisodus tanguticus]|uniref:Uncharacterized protein n=1 Tax=Anisodus tanguticus TaxID=243964 RepID=A0AAE1UVS9_9SOLA|nr:hypothetical protein RND71_039927 [Anisodus tanguticus]